MSNLSKFLVTIGMIIGFFLLFGMIVIQSKQSGSTPGVFGAILFFGLIAGLRAVWKKKKDSDNHHLDKR